MLRRPPQTWTPAQVAHWAQRPMAHGGGELGEVVSRRLWDNAIDGFLLLCGPGGPRALCGRLGIATAPEREAFERVRVSPWKQGPRILCPPKWSFL